MSEESLDLLFKRFTQADGSISRRFGGSGLGLFISHHLTEMMGGEINVSSIEGEGSTFQLVLPYKPTDTTIQIDSSRERQSSVLDEQLHGHVLIAEDTPELQMLERRILESIGLTTTIVENGQQVVEQIAKGSFDLVLMDMQMPVMDGIEATRILREQGHTLPIIALTANVMQKHREQFDEAGCDGFLGKPIDKKELRKLLKKYLSSQVIQGHELPEEVDEELMAIFRESAANYNRVLEKALANQDWELLRTTAHTVKGSSISFGFHALSKSAEAVQLAIDNGQNESLSDLARNLLAELGKIL